MGGPKRKHARYLNAWRWREKSTKEENLLKLQILREIMTMPVIPGKKSESKPIFLPNPIRDALESAKKLCRTSERSDSRR